MKHITEIPIGNITVRITTEDELIHIEHYRKFLEPRTPQVLIAGKDVSEQYINAVVEPYHNGGKMLVLSLLISGPIVDRVDNDEPSPYE